MSQPVIIKNKIVYGYMDKATVCRDMGREDYNDLTEAQQLNGDVCFIQGVDASAFAPTNSLWNKVGTTPLDSELPADCSNAINEIKNDLTDLADKTVNKSWTYAGYSYYGTNVSVNTPFTEARFYICINYNNNYRVFARGDYETDLENELINNTAVIPCGGYHLTDTDHSYIAATVTKTSSGYNFAVRDARWGNMSSTYTQAYIMVWVR